MKKVLHFVRHGTFYTFAVGIEALAPFLLAPLLTRYLTVYEYGLWAIFQSAAAFLRPMLGLTLDDYVRMRYYQHSQGKIIEYLLSMIALSVFLAVLLLGITQIFGAEISEALQFPQDWLWSVIVCAWAFAVFYLMLAYFQFGGRYRGFALVQFVQAATTIGLSVVLVVAGFGWVGAVIGKIIGLIAGIAVALVASTSQLTGTGWKRIRVDFLAELAAFGVRYLPTGMLVVIIILTDRLMLAHLENVEAASLYSVASLFPAVLLIAIRGFIMGWQPWGFQRLARFEQQDRNEVVLGALVFLVGLPVGGIILVWVSQWLGPYVIGGNFHQAFALLFPLMMAMVAQGYFLLAQSVLHYQQRLKTLSAIALAAMCLNILLDYTFIQKIGVAGAAWASLAAFGIAFIFAAGFIWHIMRNRCLSPDKESQHV